MVLELRVLARWITWTPTMVSLPTGNLHVCRHVSTSVLEKKLTCTLRLLRVRLGDGSNDYTMSLSHPQACLTVQVWRPGRQGGQASFTTRPAADHYP